MSTPKPRRRRTRLIWLVLLNCVVVAGAILRFQYVRSPAYQQQQADAAIKRQAWSTAEIHLKNMIDTNPENVEARLVLANVYREMAKKAEAGSADVAKVDPPLAVEQLLEVARLRPEDTPVRLRLLATYVDSGRGEAAVQVAQQLAALGSQQGHVVELAARAALESQNWDEAETLLERLKKIRTETSLNDMVLTVRLHEGRGDTEKIGPLLRPLMRELSQKTGIQLSGVTEADLFLIGHLLRGAVRWAPDGDIATQRFMQSLGVLEQLAKTPLGKVRRADLVDVGAQLLALAKSAPPQSREKRQFAHEQFYRFAEPVLDAHTASPLVYEQLARAAADSKDPTRALSILRRGIDQHRQLPPERQRELLALHQQAALLLLSQSRFAEVQANLGVLLEHAETVTLGHLLAAVIALDEGRLEDAARHVNQAKTDDGDPTVLEALQIRVRVVRHEWQPALDMLEALDRRWNTLSATHARWLTTLLGGREQVRFLQAGCLAQLGLSERAEALLQQLEHGPLRAQVRQVRVLSALQRGQRREAWDLLRAARREFPDEQRLVWIEFSLLVDEKAPEGATRLLAGHIRRFPQDLPSRLLMVHWLNQRGETPQALQQLAEIRRLFPNQPTGWLLTTDLLLNGGHGPALDELLKDMQNQPAVAHLLPLIQARRSLRTAGLNEADEVLQQANPELQRTAAFNVMSAAVSLARGQSEQALDRFSNSLHFTGVRAQVRSGFLQAFEQALRTANPEKLGQQVDELWKQFPDEPAVLLASAEMAARRGDFETATQRVDRLAEIDTMPGRPEYTRARLLVAQGQPVEGLAELQRVFEKAPQHPAARLFAAQLAFAQGDFAAAVTHLDALAQPAADELVPTLLRAEALTKMERVPDAEKVLIQLTSRQPQLPQGWLALSSLQNSTGRTSTAVATLESGLQRLPDQPGLQHGLVELLLRSQQADKALTAARRFSEKNAVAGNKADPATSLHWARLFLSASQYRAADEWLQQARQSTDQPLEELLFLEALALHQRAASEPGEGLFQEVRDRYGKLLELHPGHIPAMNNLAWLLLRQFHQPAEALAVVEQLRIAVAADRMTPDVLDTVIEVYQTAGRHSEALELATQSVARFPGSAVLRLQYGAVLIDEAGDNPEQRERVRQQLTLARDRGLPPHRQADLTKLLGRLNAPAKAE